MNGEIISSDSRQIYKELSIGSAKPSPNELDSVPHHFINELNLGKPFSAGLFAQQALVRIKEILSRRHTPIVVGGSTLYLHSLVHGLSPSVPSDPNVRTNIENRLAKIGKDALFEKLLQVDPHYAKTIDSSKTTRVIRALEVFELTNKPLSDFHTPPPTQIYDFSVNVLTLDRPTLYQRIEARVDAMIEAGLMEETRNIQALNLDRSLPALKSIGYQEPLAYLDGKISWERMVELIKRNSRRYAKRQFTWFRRYKSYRYIDAQSSLEDLTKTITENCRL